MYDFLIIGGGIIGMSTAMQLIDVYPDARIALLERARPGLSPDGPQQWRNPCRGLLHARQPEGAVLRQETAPPKPLRSKRYSLRQLRQDAGRHV